MTLRSSFHLSEVSSRFCNQEATSIQYYEYHEGHSWGNWRAHIDNALEMFFPSAPAAVGEKRDIPPGFRLEQNYPNPFNPSTTITFSIPSEQHVRLRVFDLLGREIISLLDERMPSGQHSVEFDVQNMASGVYLCRVEAGRFVDVKKLLLLR